jgi:hypothetical protein
MNYVSAKFVHLLLVQEQKENCLSVQKPVRICEDVIAGDETWVCGCDSKTK